MTKFDTKQRLEKLKKLINKYRYQRLVLDKSVVTALPGHHADVDLPAHWGV